MTAKKNQSKGDKPLNKTAFIKSFEDDVSADEIVAKAKDAGLDLRKKLIWTVQSEVRNSGKGGSAKNGISKAPKPAKAKKAAKVKPANKPPAKAGDAVTAAKPRGAKKSAKGARELKTYSSTAPASKSSPEQKMTALLVELGTARGDELYRSVRNKLNALVS